MTQPVVAIIATGEMGSAVGRDLANHGLRVLTSTVGRSVRSLARANQAGFELCDDDASMIAQADYLLSIVPPAASVALAERLAPALATAARKPIYADCNAVAPATARRIGELLAPAGCRYVDAGLFGGPTSGKPGIVIFASGPAAVEMSVLAEYGPVVHVIDGPIGAASAMKLSFAGLNKGFTGLGASMVRAAIRAGSAKELAEQLADSQPGILAYITRFVPAMFPKANRWDAEMVEIASFLEEDEDAAIIFQAMARIYRRLGQQVATGHDADIAALRQFCDSYRR
jgi:3-hydroxyisobutyrate dehydrogenase-like beta-hydroxyacid dehydrogenase